MDKEVGADFGEASHTGMHSPKNAADKASPATLPAGLKIMQLYVQGKSLKNLDEGRDKSDYMCVLKMKWQKDQSEWLEVDQTEVVFDSLDPKWEHCFSVVFNLG